MCFFFFFLFCPVVFFIVSCQSFSLLIFGFKQRQTHIHHRHVFIFFLICIYSSFFFSYPCQPILHVLHHTFSVWRCMTILYSFLSGHNIFFFSFPPYSFFFFLFLHFLHYSKGIIYRLSPIIFPSCHPIFKLFIFNNKEDTWRTRQKV